MLMQPDLHTFEYMYRPLLFAQLQTSYTRCLGHAMPCVLRAHVPVKAGLARWAAHPWTAECQPLATMAAVLP